MVYPVWPDAGLIVNSKTETNWFRPRTTGRGCGGGLPNASQNHCGLWVPSVASTLVRLAKGSGGTGSPLAGGAGAKFHGAIRPFVRLNAAPAPGDPGVLGVTVIDPSFHPMK